MFRSVLAGEDELELCGSLRDLAVKLDGRLILRGSPEIQLTAPIDIRVESVELDSDTLVIRSLGGGGEANDVVITAPSIISSLQRIEMTGGSFEVLVDKGTVLSYPLVQYKGIRDTFDDDPNLHRKYTRLKRILQEFRSHSKGSLAKYRDKIEHQRVLKDQSGRNVLDRLLADGVLQLKGELYHIDADRQREYLGIGWQDLCRWSCPEKLKAYLGTIPG